MPDQKLIPKRSDANQQLTHPRENKASCFSPFWEAIKEFSIEPQKSGKDHPKEMLKYQRQML